MMPGACIFLARWLKIHHGPVTDEVVQIWSFIGTQLSVSLSAVLLCQFTELEISLVMKYKPLINLAHYYDCIEHL